MQVIVSIVTKDSVRALVSGHLQILIDNNQDW